MFKAIIVSSVGAIAGALLRWWLGNALNSHFPTIPPGTLTANLIGAYVGVSASVLCAEYRAIAPEWRLLVIAGFCGALTTFSTYSAELVTLLQQGRAAWACAAAFVHLGGSIVMTFSGIGTVAWLKH